MNTEKIKQELLDFKNWVSEYSNDGDKIEPKYILDNIQKIINLSNEKETFESATRPLMKYLGENHHPHTSAYIRNDLAELLEGQEVFGTKDYILD